MERISALTKVPFYYMEERVDGLFFSVLWWGLQELQNLLLGYQE